MAADTIAAIATPAGRGGIGIVRVSGSASAQIASHILGRIPVPRQAEFHTFRDVMGDPIDQGIALFFSGPHSFTGEDVLEFQGHGGPVVLDQLLSCILALGVRMARPGEFSERAFLNGKIDLIQAEAIADLIDSSSLAASRAAQRSLQGEFSDRVDCLVHDLTRLRVDIESALDFADEEIDFIGAETIKCRVMAILDALRGLMDAAGQGSLLREGMTVVIAGPPNAGKSSLLNCLARKNAAIVTDIAGTTRDVLREQIHIDGMPLHVMDTAGLRDSQDPIEQEGIARARAEIDQADRIVFVVDDGQCRENWMSEFKTLPQERLTLVHNKIDLTGRGAAAQLAAGQPNCVELFVSVHTGEGIDLLCHHLKACMGFQGQGGGQFMARRRHLNLLQRTMAIVDRATHTTVPELVAEELRLAQCCLGEMTGTVSSDDLLGEIFSSFCIGK